MIPALAVLDLAGTTVEDPGLVAGAFAHALQAAGLPAKVDDGMGRDKRAVLAEVAAAHGLGGDAVDTLLAAFTERVLEDVKAGRYAPLPGAGEALGRLRAVGVPVALATGFPRVVAGAIVGRLGWDAWASAIVSSEEVPRGRPAPDLIHEAMRRADVARAERVAAIGDTPHDLAAGRAAGVGWNVAVTTGASETAALDPAPGDLVVPDLPAAVDVLLSVAPRHRP